MNFAVRKSQPLPCAIALLRSRAHFRFSASGYFAAIPEWFQSGFGNPLAVHVLQVQNPRSTRQFAKVRQVFQGCQGDHLDLSTVKSFDPFSGNVS